MSRLLFMSFEDAAGDAAASRYTRVMTALLPPGRAWRLLTGSLLTLLLTACADELSRLEARVSDLLNEADPTTALELLPEYERELALAANGTIAEREARVVGRLIARQRFRPVDFQAALAAILGQLSADVVVIERTHAQASAMGDDREIFRFFIYRNPALPGAYSLSSAQALVDKIKPSHTIGQVIESTSLLYDDPYSLYDRDLLGV